MTTASDRTTALAEKLRAKAASRATRTVGEDHLLVHPAGPVALPPVVLPVAQVAAAPVPVAELPHVLVVSAPAPAVGTASPPTASSSLAVDRAAQPTGSPAGLAAPSVAQMPVAPQLPAAARTGAVPAAPSGGLAVKAAAKASVAAPAAPVAQSAAPVEPGAVPVHQVGVDGLLRPVAGPTGQLGATGEGVRKLTLELPPFVIDAVNRWERDAVAAGQQRVYRERLIDCALAVMPADIAPMIARARELAPWIRAGEPEQMGTRVRDSVHSTLKTLKPELRVSRERGVFLRDLYAVAIIDYLLAIGATVLWPGATQPPVS